MFKISLPLKNSVRYCAVCTGYCCVLFGRLDGSTLSVTRNKQHVGNCMFYLLNEIRSLSSGWETMCSHNRMAPPPPPHAGNQPGHMGWHRVVLVRVWLRLRLLWSL